ncbi:MAG: transposase [Thermodesulfobacteriota bacterium]|nr:transposase [Thermodesulfobacteriota bacterium]
MPRQARIDAPGALHHIIARGIERGRIFRDDQDRNDFIRRLGQLVQESETRCLAWALIPNHFHLLLQTGNVPIATFMRRLLTGYAITHNLRHRRSGHLFQNRYKSILCQQDIYLKELVRYIHLNPLRVRLVSNMEALDKYRFAGHGYIMGKINNAWQSIDEVLSYFSDDKAYARRSYRAYVVKGIDAGKQPLLTGGGLIRSAGGWEAVRSQRKAGVFQKSDERILGDDDFVKTVLSAAQEELNNRYSLAAKGVQLDDIVAAVSRLLSVSPVSLAGPSKERTVAKGRALVCYWAVRELGMSMTSVAETLKIAVPTVSNAVKKGQAIADQEDLSLGRLLNVKI